MFLTITEAQRYLNNQKSYSALNRLVHKLKSDKTTKHYIKSVKGKNLISKEYLDKNFFDMVNGENQHKKTPINHEITDFLKEQLNKKDEQINNLTSLVNDYSERLKESHYTIESLSNKLALLEKNPPPITTDNQDEKKKLKKALSELENFTLLKKIRFLFTKVDSRHYNKLIE
jgi:hypothetical protein